MSMSGMFGSSASSRFSSSKMMIHAEEEKTEEFVELDRLNSIVASVSDDIVILKLQIDGVSHQILEWEKNPEEAFAHIPEGRQRFHVNTDNYRQHLEDHLNDLIQEKVVLMKKEVSLINDRGSQRSLVCLIKKKLMKKKPPIRFRFRFWNFII